MQNNEPQSQSHNDLDNLDNLTDEQINELYDDVYIDNLIAYCRPGHYCKDDISF